MSNFLYNGVELPALPEYAILPSRPYAHIVYSRHTRADGSYYYHSVLYVFTVRPFVDREQGKLSFPVDGKYNGWVSTDYSSHTISDWTTTGSDKNVSAGTNHALALPIWANYDLLNEDGTLYLAASDPVPVPQLNHAALMQGFTTMLSLKK